MDMVISLAGQIDKIIGDHKRDEKKLCSLLPPKVFELVKCLADDLLPENIDISDISTIMQYLDLGMLVSDATRDDYFFLRDFWCYYRNTKNFIVLSPDEQGHRLLHYYRYLCGVKNLIKNRYKVDVLSNVELLPIKDDRASREYFEGIAKELVGYRPTYTALNDQTPSGMQKWAEKGKYLRYYVWDQKPFYWDGKVFYEISYTLAQDGKSKFDKNTAYSREQISPDGCAVRMGISRIKIPIKPEVIVNVVDSWMPSIRACEYKKLTDIFSFLETFKGDSAESNRISVFMKRNNLSLREIICLDDVKYRNFTEMIDELGGNNREIKKVIIPFIDACREIVSEKKFGENLIRLLTEKVRNEYLRDQFDRREKKENSELSNMCFKYGAIPFERMPFCTSLCGHNLLAKDIASAIPIEGHEHELIPKQLENIEQNERQIFCVSEELSNETDIAPLVDKFNNTLYFKHKDRSIDSLIHKGQRYFYHRQSVDDIKSLLERFEVLTKTMQVPYNTFASWGAQSGYIGEIDDKNKLRICENITTNNKIAFIYGSAGTGKSMLLSYLANYYRAQGKDIYFIANTNAAKKNLIDRLPDFSRRSFRTVSGFIKGVVRDIRGDVANNGTVLILDECSTISNEDMRKILLYNPYAMIMAGDDHQIESIDFGNWFTLCKQHFASKCVYELERPYRSTNPELLSLWTAVRNKAPDIEEQIKKFSKELSEEAFNIDTNKNEVTLCLNYSGFYGINNINSLCQQNNPNEEVVINGSIFKEGDPILFNSGNEYSRLLFGDLKGKIIEIGQEDDEFLVKIDIEDFIAEEDCVSENLEFYGHPTEDRTLIGVRIKDNPDTDNDTGKEDTTPFSLAYSVSFHRSQGLEFDRVNIVISGDCERNINLNAFYTAITRARKELVIYWMPDTMSRVINGLKSRDYGLDYTILKEHFLKKN